jgi:lipid-binding SYLF domain-containing protein
MKNLICNLLICLGVITSAWAAGDTERARVRESGFVMQEILQARDKGIPKSVLDGAKCVIVIPSMMKAAFGIGGNYGRGVMTCRTGDDFKGPWSPPVMMASGGGSFGFQIGVQATDYVILVMNDRGARDMLRNKVKLGADVSAAAGPLGRTAEASTNGKMTAQMLSYSHTRGVFGGISLLGATLRPDKSADRHLYGKQLSGEAIINSEGITMPPEAQPLVDTLTAHTSGHETGHPTADKKIF